MCLARIAVHQPVGEVEQLLQAFRVEQARGAQESRSLLQRRQGEQLPEEPGVDLMVGDRGHALDVQFDGRNRNFDPVGAKDNLIHAGRYGLKRESAQVVGGDYAELGLPLQQLDAEGSELHVVAGQDLSIEVEVLVASARQEVQGYV